MEPFTREYLMRLATGAPRAFWRVDCDTSLPAAERMARFLQVCGVRATFFVMAVGEFYNPLAPSARTTRDVIVGCGHDIALHCDFRRPGAVWPEVRRQRGLLADAFMLTRSDLVSFHMPGPVLMWRDFDEFESTYASRWRGRYVSDSRRLWGPAKAAQVREGVQVCLHPEHWDI